MLRFILASHEIKVDFGVMAKLLGPNCTPRAVQEQLKKLKKVGLEEAAAAAGTGVVVASPAKRAKRAKPAASKEPKKGQKVKKDEAKEESKERFKEEVEEGGDDNESILGSPAKRPRTK